MVQQRGCLHVARTGNIAVLSDFLCNILFITLKTAMVNLPEWKSIHTKNVSISRWIISLNYLNFSTPPPPPPSHQLCPRLPKRQKDTNMHPYKYHHQQLPNNRTQLSEHSSSYTFVNIFFNIAFWLQLSMRQLVMVLLCIVAYFPSTTKRPGMPWTPGTPYQMPSAKWV